MDRAQALRELLALFEGAPDITGVVDQAMSAALVVDPFGRAPIDPDYAETVDVYWAAAWIADRFALTAALAPSEPVVERFSSEGTDFTIKGGAGPDWASVAARFRALSPLGSAGAGIGLIDAPSSGTDFIPRSAWL